MTLIRRIRWLRILFLPLTVAATIVWLSILLPAPLWIVALSGGAGFLLISPAIYFGFKHEFLKPLPQPTYCFTVMRDSQSFPFEHAFTVTTLTIAEAATLIFDHRPIMLSQPRDDMLLEETVKRLRKIDERLSYDSFEWNRPEDQIQFNPGDIIIVADMEPRDAPPPSATLTFRKLVW